MSFTGSFPYTLLQCKRAIIKIIFMTMMKGCMIMKKPTTTIGLYDEKYGLSKTLLTIMDIERKYNEYIFANIKKTRS